MKTIYADFNNIGLEGFIRLTCVGTTRDLEAAGVVLVEGLQLTVSDGDLIADIVVRKSAEGSWGGEFIGEIRDC